MAGRPEDPAPAPLPLSDEDVRKSVPIRKKPTREKGIKIHPFTIDKLCEENARHWFHMMENQLKAQFSWEAIECYHEVGREEFNKILEDVEWFKINLKADMIIEQGLQPTTILYIKDLGNAGLKWDRLKEMFLKPSNANNPMRLMKMANWTWDPARMNEKEAYQEIKQLGKEFIDMNGSNKITVEELIVLWYLRGLGDKYATLRDTVTSSNVTLDEDYILNRIDDIMHMKRESTGEGSCASKPRRKNNIKCFVCGKIGHRARKCPNRHDNYRDKDDDDDDAGSNRDNSRGQKSNRNRNRKPTRQRGRVAEDYERQNDASARHGFDDEYTMHAIKSTRDRAEFASQKAYLAESYKPSVWCFNSTMSTCTGNRDIFEYIDPTRHGTVATASGTQLPIAGQGIVKFSLPNGSEARLGGVIYVPGLAENLLSLEALHLAGFESEGSIDGYNLMKDGKLMAKGKRIGRTTYLDTVRHIDALFTGPKAAKLRQYACLALPADEEVAKKQQLIHRRLGHPGRNRFNNCVGWMDMNELRINKRDPLLDDKCEICLKAKQMIHQSHKPVPRAQRPLQCVYMDFWGPSHDSVGDEKYYLCLIDDCTRFSWLFAMVDRKIEHVICTLETWLRQVERQAGRLLLVIRTDNAAAFVTLKPWGKLKDIKFEFIGTETPAQNDVAERFNRIILEMAKALLFDAKISKEYWKYAVVTANYLRNRTILVKKCENEKGEEKTPYELWYGHRPDLTHLRAWGCRVLYYEKPDSKLGSRVSEGTFLKYGESDKQYEVLPRDGTDLKLVTDLEFRERENGYLSEPSANQADV